MTIRYSSKTVKKHICVEDSTRVYKAQLLGAEHIALEGFKISKSVVPALGTGMDYLQQQEGNIFDDTSHVVGATLQHLSDSFPDEQWATLVDKILGSLVVNDKPVEWQVHFDEYPEELFEIIVWLLDENFRPFLLRNTMFQSLMKKTKSPQIQKAIENFKNMFSNETTQPSAE